MALTTRRQFVQQTAFAAAALYGRSMNLLAGTRRIFGAKQQNVATFDAAVIRKLASQITGRVITPEASEYESSRLTFNRAFDQRPAVIVRCASASDVARASELHFSSSCCAARRLNRVAQ